MSKLSVARRHLNEASDEYLRDRLLGAVAAIKLIGSIESNGLDDRDDVVAAVRYLGISIEADLLELKCAVDAVRGIIDDIQARSPLPVTEGGGE